MDREEYSELSRAVNHYLRLGYRITVAGEVYNKRDELVEVLEWPEGVNITFCEPLGIPR